MKVYPNQFIENLYGWYRSHMCGDEGGVFLKKISKFHASKLPVNKNWQRKTIC